MDPPQPPHHHHRLHLRLDRGHHHRIHIHLRHHAAHLLPAAAPCAHHHHQHTSVPPPHPLPCPPTAAEGPLAVPQGEAAGDAEDPAPRAERGEEVYLVGQEEEWGDEEEEPVFVLTEEWAEFFAKADAKRRLGKSRLVLSR
ncbi:forkhead box protein B2-like [Hordeum vulgare]|nr:forkhead box protein B2-like [Hordeum vulgare]